MDSTSITGNVQENFGELNKVKVYSDTHFTPPEITRAIIPILGGSISSKNRISLTSFIEEMVKPPEESGTIRIMLGDFLHLNPLFPWQKDFTNTAMCLFADLLKCQPNVSEYLKWVPGNHDPINKIPQEIQNSLIEQRILIPNDEIKFTSANEEFIAMHGHQIQPGFHYFPFENNPHLEKIFHNLITLYRKKSNLNGVKELYYPYSKALNRLLNLPALIWKEKNLPKSKHLISGHTHVPISDAEKRYHNPGLRDPLLNILSYLLIENGEVSLKFQEI